MKTYRIEVLKKVCLLAECESITEAAQKAREVIAQNSDTKLLGVIDVEAEAIQQQQGTEITIQ